MSPTTSDVVIEGMKAAKAQGAICSFDLNYRAKLWATMGGLEKAQQVGSEIASLCDVLVGNEEDLQLGLVRTHSCRNGHAVVACLIDPVPTCLQTGRCWC